MRDLRKAGRGSSQRRGWDGAEGHKPERHSPVLGAPHPGGTQERVQVVLGGTEEQSRVLPKPDERDVLRRTSSEVETSEEVGILRLGTQAGTLKPLSHWHMPKPVVVGLILSILANTALIAFLFIRGTIPTTREDRRTYARLASIYWIVDKYSDYFADKKLSRPEKMEVSKVFVSLPDDRMTIRALAISALESGYWKESISNKNAIGISQFIKSTALPYLRELGYNPTSKEAVEALLKKPEVSARICYNHISDLHIICKDDYKKVLYAYNHDTTYVRVVSALTDKIQQQYDSVFIERAAAWRYERK